MMYAVIVLELGILVYLLIRFVIKPSPNGDWIPTCLSDGRPMVKVPPTKDKPDAIKHYLTTYELPLKVVRKYVCQKCGRELWIAPQVEDMEKSMFVGRKA
jgi:hypothetical protein